MFLIPTSCPTILSFMSLNCHPSSIFFRPIAAPQPQQTHTHIHTQTREYSIEQGGDAWMCVFILGQTVGSRGWKTNLEWRMVQYFSISVTVLRSASLSVCLSVCLSACLPTAGSVWAGSAIPHEQQTSNTPQINTHPLNMESQVAVS